MLKLFFYTLLVFFQSPVIHDINKEDVIDFIEEKSIDVIDLRTDKNLVREVLNTPIILTFKNVNLLII
ncbi:MAG: hypothetical protein CM15mP102_07980 [Flavobacteriales bacterium]|nr:MAG: hypothetical protein CM15mP102_07980 [Flavobacteriales bacterium]